MSVYKIPVRIEAEFLTIFVKILSINVAEVLVTLVGLEIVGITPNSVIISRKSCVAACLSILIKLMFTSPNKWIYFLLVLIFANNPATVSLNSQMSVLGGLYTTPTTTFRSNPNWSLSNSQNTDSILLSIIHNSSIREHSEADWDVLVHADAEEAD